MKYVEENEFDFDKYAPQDELREGVSRLHLAYKAKDKEQGSERKLARKRKLFAGSGV